MCKIISKYSKTGYLKYISHLDVLRFIQRSIKRAGINAKYSEGFNPHMKTSFGFPLSLGTESMGEYFEVELDEKIEPEVFIYKMNAVMPKEMQILKASISNNPDSIMKRCRYAQYLINIETTLDVDELNNYFKEMLNEGVVFSRQRKNRRNKLVSKEINTKEMIKYLKAEKTKENNIRIEALFITGERGSMRVDELLKLIEDRDFTIDYYTILKVDALDKEMKPLL
ncbi:MAG: DUF2344 domain-containing protein [Tissierellia bacterium]|nr:DUF2344 domain-containing protein [Tissierellia bacterium]